LICVNRLNGKQENQAVRVELINSVMHASLHEIYGDTVYFGEEGLVDFKLSYKGNFYGTFFYSWRGRGFFFSKKGTFITQ
jgi:hypothetical protein